MTLNLLAKFGSRRNPEVTAAVWDGLLTELALAINGIQEKSQSFTEARDQLIQTTLFRVNELITPAFERVTEYQTGGFLTAGIDAETEVAFVEGQQTILVEADKRDLFRPTPFVALTRSVSTADVAFGQALSYDEETGALVVDVSAVIGAGGTFADVIVTATAGSVQAQKTFLDETKAARTAAVAAAEQTEGDREQTALDRIATGQDRMQTGEDRAAAEVAAAAAATFDPANYPTVIEFEAALSKLSAELDGLSLNFAIAQLGVRQDSYNPSTGQIVAYTDGGQAQLYDFLTEASRSAEDRLTWANNVIGTVNYFDSYRVDEPVAGRLIPYQLSNTGVVTFSDYNSGTATWQAFYRMEGATTQRISFSSVPVNGERWLQIDFGAAKTVKAYYSFRNSSSIGTSYRIQSSTDGVTWVDRSAIVVERFARFASPVTARYWRVVAKNIYTSTQNFEIYGIQLFEAIPPTELVSRSLTADVSPSTARFFLRAGSITLDEGPDVSGNMSVEISRDGGANWTAASLTLLQEMVDSFHIYWTGDVDLSAQPAGTEMTFHLTTLADKPTFKTAAILEWSDA